MGQIIDRSGRQYGLLRVIGFAGINRNAKATWNCECACGNQVVAVGAELGSGHTGSCGCLQKARASEASRKHGLTDTPEHLSWKHMRARCLDPKNKNYDRYGGRGIRICERWDDFAAFYADMGPRPSSKHSIDRINNDGNYEPGNCRWATQKEQVSNSTRVRMIECHGRVQSLEAWAQETGLSRDVIRSRVSAYGWSVERALSEPKRKTKRAP